MINIYICYTRNFYMEYSDLLSSLEGIEYKTKVFNKGDVIVRQGDLCKGLYLLTKGSVKTEMVNDNGGLLSIEKIYAVRPLAPAFIFAKVNIFPVDVIALEKSEVLLIAKEDLLKLFQRDSKFLEKYIQFNSDKTQFLSNKLQMLTIKTIRGKLAYYILDIFLYQQPNPKSNIIILDKNQTELAKFFGVTRPSLARALSEMESEGLIEINKKAIKILDFNGLKEVRG